MAAQPLHPFTSPIPVFACFSQSLCAFSHRCVHPKTGRVCVPVDPEAAMDFEPSKVPSLRTLEADLNSVRPRAIPRL